MFWLFVVKELKSIARDPKMLIAMVVVPLILIGALYFVLGQGIAQQIEQAERESGTVAVIDLDKGNYSNLFIDFLNGIGLTVKLLEPNTTTDVVELVKNIDTKIIYLIPSGFSANFSRAMPAYVVTYVKIESLTIGETGVVAVADRYVGIFNKYILETVAREKGIEEVFLSGLSKKFYKGFF
uniref:ABC-2 type transporter transmembrane domain-containing protein n=1 Tax=Ignisphaera aggregans TaxID=334771 RepID=A0A7C2Z8B5_9CREN